METELYRIDEQCTSGWENIETNITKEECQKKYEELVNEGVSPKRLKITRIQ